MVTLEERAVNAFVNSKNGNGRVVTIVSRLKLCELKSNEL